VCAYRRFASHESGGVPYDGKQRLFFEQVLALAGRQVVAVVGELQEGRARPRRGTAIRSV
jgi:hypothetical protein